MIRIEMKNYFMISTEAAKISALSQGKIDKSDIQEVKKYYLLIKEEWLNKLSLHIIRKSFRKTNQNNWGSGKKQRKAFEDHGKHLVQSNDLITKDFNINRDRISLEEERKYLMNLLKKGLLIFAI